ncbi:MAG: hypothetical protein L0216_03075, partial [Planctomycetales bacterium]|nr:hypothetical protein [Planctomycetales bacterium]
MSVRAAIAAGVLLASAGGAGAQDRAPAGPSVRLRIGGQPVGRVFRPGAPLPIALQLSAPPGRGVAGRVAVVRLAAKELPGEEILFEADVDLPPAGTRLVRGLGLPLPAKARALEARWEEGGAGGPVVARDSIPNLAPLGAAQAWVLVLGGDATVAASLVARKPPDAEDDWAPPWIVSAARADLLPRAVNALAAADLIVIAGGFEDSAHPGPDAADLSPVLHAFVGSGGSLLVGGGDAGLAAAGPVLGLLPVQPSGTAPGDIAPIVEMFAPRAETETLPLLRARLRDGTALALSSDGAPLAATASRGLGDVTWLACGLADAGVRKAGLARDLAALILARSGRARAPSEDPAAGSAARCPVLSRTGPARTRTEVGVCQK